MSQYFQNGDDVLWNPATRVAGLFLDMAEAHARMLGIPSGLGPMEEDECQVDVQAFASFTDALVRYHANSSHRILKSLMEGFVATALAIAIADNVAGPVAAVRERADDPAVRRLVDLAHQNAAAMPR
ncbi:DUF6086 family protein [Actinomadura luteofluorescens]|uniref:DUF6086 family protein n=1 Tax=Actinomadura luteofluorescens TaxID=46163 RepID=UPI0034836F36